jgi:dihydroorotate dehydrogenase
MCLLGIGMMISGILAWIIAATTVLLPYDEAFLGIGAAQLKSIYPQLIFFMSHDRITLAGTMISIGVIYFLLARYGLRYELHWAKTALMTSGIVGFSSFFLYLGYGYFDPLHALAAAILLPMFVLSMRSGGDRLLRGQPNLVNDRKWLFAQWGQLMFVILGIAFAIGGVTISCIGITDVFVLEDLGYLKTTPDALLQLNERLLSLIAHDRAGFGGALLSNSIAILATALWGIQQGERWIWWMFLLGGFPGFLAGFSVHWAIGYTDFFHLLPAYFAFTLYVLGLALLYPYLMKECNTIK